MNSSKFQHKFFKFLKKARLGAALLWTLAFAALFYGAAFLAPMAKCQAGPALGSLGIWAAASLMAILLLTFVFGRFYCGLICPFGVLQEIAGYRKKHSPRRTFGLWRALLAGFLLGGLAAGSSLALQLAGPYAIFGRIIGFGGLGSALALGFLLLVSRFGRLFCDTICPIGALLGLVAGHSLFKLQITSACRHCGKCQKKCPTGCLDSVKHTLDDSRCVRCLNCLAACHENAIALLPAGKEDRNEPDQGRRRFLTRDVPALAAGAAMGFGTPLVLRPLLAGRKVPLGVLPPGAGEYARFIFKCTNCRLCAANCPGGIIKSPKWGLGPVTLDFGKNGCMAGCVRCSGLCPTGALLPVKPEDKGRLVIGKARLDATLCQVYQAGEKCGLCQMKCPYGAIALMASGAPRLNSELCLGCGNCVAVCPKKAISVEGIKIQQLLSKEEA